MSRQVVIDTNVFISALRSRRGASFKLLSLVGSGAFEINLSVPLILEYESVAKRSKHLISLDTEDVDDVLNYLCQVARCHQIYYLWRPFLRDPKDDMVLELAVKAGYDYVITFNREDFQGIERFGLKTIFPQEFLMELGKV